MSTGDCNHNLVQKQYSQKAESLRIKDGAQSGASGHNNVMNTRSAPEWNEADQKKHKLSWVNTICNEIPVKEK